MLGYHTRFIALCCLISISSLSAQTAKRVGREDAVSEKLQFEKHAKIALVVGVDAYPQASNLSPLKYASADAVKISAVLKEQGYLVRTLVNTDALRGSVRNSITQLSQAVDEKEGMFLFYFSGHGFAVDGNNYLATYGTTAEDLKLEGLAVAEVEKLLRASRAKRVLMFMDACRNDPNGAKSVSGSPFSEDRRQRLESSEGVRILYSTKAGTYSYESPELRQGVFTHFLLKGLAGEASGYSRESRNSDGLISFTDLSTYMVDQMRKYAFEGKGMMQIPYESGESTGDFLVATKTLDEGKLQSIRQSGEAVQQRVVQPQTTQFNNLPVPANPTNVLPSQGLGAIAKDAGSAKLASLPQVWRDTVENRLFRIKFEAEHAYLYDHQLGKVLAELTLKKRKGKPDLYEGKTTLAAKCPGGQGDIEINSWSPTRIQMKVEEGNVDNKGVVTCGKAFGIGFIRSMRNIVLVSE